MIKNKGKIIEALPNNIIIIKDQEKSDLEVNAAQSIRH